MSSNLFVVSTPFHLLTAAIIAVNRKEDINYLALVHPHGYKDWYKSRILESLCSDNFIFFKTYFLIDWMKTGNGGLFTYRKQSERIKTEIGSLGIDNIFLGSDMDTQNQLLVAVLGNDFYYRLDDGIYSYYNKDRKRSCLHRIFHKCKLRLISMLMGVEPRIEFNGDVLGEGKNCEGDYLYRPELLRRYSKNLFEIDSVMIDNFMKALSKRNLCYQEFFGNDFILYLSQPTVEQGRITFEKELSMIRYILETLDVNQRLIYKPHPKDKAYKLQLLKEKFPDIILLDSKEPVEIILAKEPQISTLVSYASTTLILADKFCKRNVKCVSLLKTLEKNIGSEYIKIFEDSGCRFLEINNKG